MLVDRNGRVLEGTRSNFFAFSNNTLHTADEDLVLGGITRSEVLRSARELGFTIDLNPIYLEDLFAGRFTEVFISATSMAAMPLHTIDDLRFSAPFERTRALHDCVRPSVAIAGIGGQSFSFTLSLKEAPAPVLL